METELFWEKSFIGWWVLIRRRAKSSWSATVTIKTRQCTLLHYIMVRSRNHCCHGNGTIHPLVLFQYLYRASFIILYYYQQMHNYLTNCFTNICIWNTCVTWQSYWLQASWGWHDSVETCRSTIICEIIVHLLVIVQNKKSLLLFLAYV